MKFLKSLFLALCLTGQSVHADDDQAHVTIREIADGVWLHVSDHVFEGGIRYTANGVILRDGAGLMLIDTAWGIENTRLLLAEIQAQIGLPVTRAIVTHAHDDRVSGADVLEEQGIEVTAFSRTREIALANGLAVPDHELALKNEPGALVEVGPVEVFYPGAAHAPDNIVVWLPAAQILVGGCMVKAADAKSLGYIGDADLVSWPDALDRVTGRYGPAKIVVPGHGDIADVGLIKHTKALLVAAQP